MNFNKFSNSFSFPRIQRYHQATNKNEKKTIKLYQYNLRLSQEMFSIISCFEVILRNAINIHFTEVFSEQWLNEFVEDGGVFDEKIPHNKNETDNERNSIKYTKYRIINAKNRIINAKNKLDNKEDSYTPFKHIAELGLGVWCSFFNTGQYIRTIEKKSNKAKRPSKRLLDIFPKRPQTTNSENYNPTYIHEQIKAINVIRNRIAHHEPICFKKSIINTQEVRENYKIVLMLLGWMDIDGKELFNQLKLNRVIKICDKIDQLKR